MGTNYYVTVDNPCKYCGRGGENLHIGKSSIGWCFSLHVIPERGLNDLPDWEKFWRGKIITNEYGEKINKKTMLDIITKRGQIDNYRQRDASFHRDNHSEDGPNGLVRSRIGSNCIGHGKGTWDLISGEFS